MNIYEKLLEIQAELKAPKNQRNTFGGYNYRSCEDILEAVKPITKKNKTVLIVTDEIVLMGDRHYIAATAVLSDTESEGAVKAVAYAREPEVKKGMDSSQITGAASSYARKYALNGLFAIDDNKDSDTDENTAETNIKALNEDKEQLEEEKKQLAGENERLAKENERLIAIYEFVNASLENGFTKGEQELLVSSSYKGIAVKELKLKQAQTLTNKITNSVNSVRAYIQKLKEET